MPDKQDERHYPFPTLPSASHQFLAGNSEYRGYTPRSWSVSVQHGSPVWSVMLIAQYNGAGPTWFILNRQFKPRPAMFSMYLLMFLDIGSVYVHPQGSDKNPRQQARWRLKHVNANP